ncbi:MAG: recombinase zinc beta ribbon domain-containing protein [Oscillospiraceae bacterium]|nr:recombinase zinc beta ribbon domain-containing protein [Oscillospiraceae bacterium]
MWDRANALYKRRSEQMMSHQSAAEFHNRYPYSGKIVCEEHNTSFHRQVLTSAKGSKEVWQCRVYRNRGRAACSAPQLRTDELNEVMAQIFTELVHDKQTIIDALVAVIQSVPQEHDFARDMERLESEAEQINAKKDRLLDLSMAGAITISEFKTRNDGFNEQLTALESKLEVIRQEQQKTAATTDNLEAIKTALRHELDFTDGVNSELVTTILDHIIVKKVSTREEVHLDIHLKVNGPYEAVFARSKSSFCISRLKSTTPPIRSRRT